MDIVREFELSTKDFNQQWETLIWVLSSECGWSQEDILNAEIPFVLQLMDARTRILKKQEKELKRNK